MSLENKEIKQFDIFYKDIHISDDKNNRPCIILSNVEKELENWYYDKTLYIKYIHLTSKKNKWNNNQIKLENYNSFYSPEKVHTILYNELRYSDFDQNIQLTKKDHQNLKKIFSNIV